MRVPTPERLVEPDGTVHVGRFTAPVPDPNLAAAPATHLLASLRRTPLHRLERRLRQWRLKQRQSLSVVTDRVFVHGAVFHAGYLATACVYVVNRVDGGSYAWSRTLPLARGCDVAAGSLTGRTRFADAEWGSLTFDDDAVAGERSLAVELRGQPATRTRGARPALFVEYQVREGSGGAQPMARAIELLPGRWVYAHMCYGLTAGGYVDCGDIQQRVDTGHARAGYEWHRGYDPVRTSRLHAAAAGADRHGRPVGLYLRARSASATLHRPAGCAGAAAGDECILWLNGLPCFLPPVAFAVPPDDVRAPWRITDAAGCVDVTFTPDGVRNERLAFAFARSSARLFYGTFTGTLRSPEGKRYPLDAVYGMAEHRVARW